MTAAPRARRGSLPRAETKTPDRLPRQKALRRAEGHRAFGTESRHRQTPAAPDTSTAAAAERRQLCGPMVFRPPLSAGAQPPPVPLPDRARRPTAANHLPCSRPARREPVRTQQRQTALHQSPAAHHEHAGDIPTRGRFPLRRCRAAGLRACARANRNRQARARADLRPDRAR